MTIVLALAVFLLLIGFSGSLAQSIATDGALDPSASALVPALAIAMVDRLAGFARSLLRRSSEDRLPLTHESLAEIYRQGLEARDAGRLGLAVRAFQEILRREPTHAEAHARLADLARERGDAQAALLHSLQALRSDSRSGAALAAAADYRRAGRPDDAIALYRGLLGREPDHLTALRHLRDALADAGRWDDVLPVQERLVKLIPPDERAAEQMWLAGIHYELGMARLRRDEPAGAVGPLREALRIRPDFLAAAVALGDAHLRAGDQGQALRAWERGLEAHPALPLLSRIERVYRSEDRPRRMIALYEQAAARVPDDLSVAVALGRVYFELSMLDEAAEQFEKIEVRAPDLPAVHAYLGAVFERRNQARESLHEYRRALELTASFDWPHRCVACGARHTEWTDRCPSCRRWNTLKP